MGRRPGLKPILCIYHGNCADGFGAAWVVRKALGEEDVEFYPGVYQTAPPDVTERDVIMVDFSYKQKTPDEMSQCAKATLILDHHKTAVEDLSDVPIAPSWTRWQRWDDPLLDTGVGAFRRGTLFDMNRSGAGITWDYFFPDQERPALINHIEDRDLWRFTLPGTREIQANVFSYPYDFEVWDKLMAAPVESLIAEGRAIERKHFKDIAELVKVCRREMTIGGIVVPVASLPYTLTSDAGHLMATEHPSKVGVGYWDTLDGRCFSLRSTDDGPDVSESAKQYGGGGHQHASGFKVPYGHELTK